jgi:hypothetical protein
MSMAKGQGRSSLEAQKPSKTVAERSRSTAVSTTSGRALSAASKERAGKGGST